MSRYQAGNRQAKTQYTSENPCASLGIQGFHGTFVLLALLRELLSQRPFTALIRFAALFEAFSHLLALLICLCAEVHVVLIMLIRLVLVLQMGSLVICTVRETSTNYGDLLGIMNDHAGGDQNIVGGVWKA